MTKFNRQFYRSNMDVVSDVGACLYTDNMFSCKKKCSNIDEAVDLCSTLNAAFGLGYRAAQEDMQKVLGVS